MIKMYNYPITCQDYSDDPYPEVKKSDTWKIEVAKQKIKFVKDLKSGKIKNPHPKMIEMIKHIW